MNHGEELIALYENVANYTAQMLQAAQDHDLDQFAALELRCAQEMSSLRAKDPVTALSPSLRARKAEIIERVLADHRAIERITRPWMNELKALIHNTGNQRKLETRYGAVGGL